MTNTHLSRRAFTQLLLVSGIGISFVHERASAAPAVLAPEWWVEVDANGEFRLLTNRVEMGQGAHTGLRTLLAEELDVEPTRIRIVQVPSDPKYGAIVTGGSYTVAGWHERMRKAGATARYMLLQAAAADWQVPFEELQTDDGHIIHPQTNARASYARFVSAAERQALAPAVVVPLKQQSKWRYIGKPAPIAYHEEIVRGAARFGIDRRLPGMLFAVLARAPVIGATVKSMNDEGARTIPGFVRTLRVSGNQWPQRDHCREAIAVVAENSWAAQKARAAIQIEWNIPETRVFDTKTIYARLERALDTDVVVSAEQRIESEVEAPTIERRYRLPYLAHAPMEPPNATAMVTNDRVEVWSGTQRQTRMQEAIAQRLKLPKENVTVHAELIGGSFGRRLEVDYGIEAASIAAQLRRPVQVLWTRDDDLQCGLYRAASVHQLSARLNTAGKVVRFEHAFAADSVFLQQEPQEIGSDGSDWTLAAPLVTLLYDIPAFRLAHRAVTPIIPCAWWRGTYWTNVTSVVECFIDELAQASDQDPLAFRLRHLHSAKVEFAVNKDTRVTFDPSRMRRVLEAAAARANWSEPTREGHSRGLACGIYDSPECHAAVVVEATLRSGTPVLTRAVVAVDVGTAVNPNVVEAQCVSGFVLGASAALKEQITFEAGRVQQTGFADYGVMRANECPAIEVVIVPSVAGICGVGEIVTPAAIAAVTNAVSRLLRKRVTTWPILRDNN